MDREFIKHMIDAERRGRDATPLCRDNAGSIMELLHELHEHDPDYPDVDPRTGDEAETSPNLPGPTAHELCEQAGVTKERLSAALKSNDNWGKLTHSFEYLTACSAVLASWPDPLSHPPVRMEP